MDEYEYEFDDPEVKEVEENIKWHLAHVNHPNYHAYLRAQGKNPEEVIAFYREIDAEFRAMKRETSKIMEAREEAVLQTAADLADSELALYKSMSRAYKNMKELTPFHSELPAMEAFLEEARKRIPKDEQ
jgi:metal-dependent amidase/aminoacylase/carboxypeptidase family protein